MCSWHGNRFSMSDMFLQYNPPNTLVVLMQQAGRGARDGLQSHTNIYYTRQELSHCSKDVKTVVTHAECQRKELYSYFTESVSTVEPGHKSCSNCRKECRCLHKHLTMFYAMEVFQELFEDICSNKEQMEEGRGRRRATLWIYCPICHYYYYYLSRSFSG